MILGEFSTALGCADNEVLLWLRALGLTEPCSRCQGTGCYDAREQVLCFKCQGHADQLPKLTLVLCREVARRVVRGELRAYFAARRHARRTVNVSA